MTEVRATLFLRNRAGCPIFIPKDLSAFRADRE